MVINPTPTGIHKTVVGKSGTDARKSSLTDSSSKSPRSITPLSPRDTSVTANGFKSPSPARVVSPVERQPQKEISPAPKEPTPPPKELTPPPKETTPPLREATPPPVSPVVKAPSPKPEASLSLVEREEILTRKVGRLSLVVKTCHTCG